MPPSRAQDPRRTPIPSYSPYPEQTQYYTQPSVSADQHPATTSSYFRARSASQIAEPPRHTSPHFGARDEVHFHGHRHPDPALNATASAGRQRQQQAGGFTSTSASTSASASASASANANAIASANLNAGLGLLPWCTSGMRLRDEQAIALSDLGGSLREIMIVALAAAVDERARAEMERAVGKEAAAAVIEFWREEFAMD